MSPLGHALVTLALGAPKDLRWGLLPDVANLPIVMATKRIPESDVRVKLSRIAHSPLTVLLLLILTKGHAWPYAVHWLCDLPPIHKPHQVFWPFVREKIK